jgi:hypothetical protein
MGNLKAATGALDEAIDYYRLALTVYPKHAMACNNLAIVMAKKGRLRDAAELFRKALLLNPGLVVASENLAKLERHTVLTEKSGPRASFPFDRAGASGSVEKHTAGIGCQPVPAAGIAAIVSGPSVANQTSGAGAAAAGRGELEADALFHFQRQVLLGDVAEFTLFTATLAAAIVTAAATRRRARCAGGTLEGVDDLLDRGAGPGLAAFVHPAGFAGGQRQGLTGAGGQGDDAVQNVKVGDGHGLAIGRQQEAGVGIGGRGARSAR